MRKWKILLTCEEIINLATLMFEMDAASKTGIDDIRN